MVSEEDIALESSKCSFELLQNALPIKNNLHICNHSEEIHVPPPLVVHPQRPPFHILCLPTGTIIEHSRDEHDGDEVTCAGFAPLIEEFGKERVNDLLRVPFSVPCKLPEFAADLDEERYLGRE